MGNALESSHLKDQEGNYRIILKPGSGIGLQVVRIDNGWRGSEQHFMTRLGTKVARCCHQVGWGCRAVRYNHHKGALHGFQQQPAHMRPLIANCGPVTSCRSQGCSTFTAFQVTARTCQFPQQVLLLQQRSVATVILCCYYCDEHSVTSCPVVLTSHQSSAIAYFRI